MYSTSVCVLMYVVVKGDGGVGLAMLCLVGTMYVCR